MTPTICTMPPRALQEFLRRITSVPGKQGKRLNNQSWIAARLRALVNLIRPLFTKKGE